MRDPREDKLTRLADACRRGHASSVAEADRTLRQIRILTGDPTTSSRLLRDVAPSAMDLGPAR